MPTKPRTTKEAPRYFLIEGPPDALAKIDDDTAYVWRDGTWEQDSWAARKISAYDGDVEARPIDVREAHRFIQEEQVAASAGSRLPSQASPEHSIRAENPWPRNESLTPEMCVEFALRTEEAGAELYDRLARKFASDGELAELFRDLGRDELQHAQLFRVLRDRLSQRPEARPLPPDQAMVVADVFSGPAGLATAAEGVATRDDALERALNLEKATLAYYQGVREIIGADEALDALIAVERKHVLKVMQLLVTGAKFRGLADSF
jgi:rubrerythrin